MAVTPPMGPVFLSVPLDILDMENDEEICATSPINFQVAPAEEHIFQITRAIAEAKNPIILAGDGVSESHSVEELESCAELAAIPVYGVNSSCINISQLSPYYKGDLGHMFGENSKKAVQNADVVLIVGTYTFPEVFPELKSPFRQDARVFHIDLNSYEIAKNHPVTMGICASPKTVLAKINEQLRNIALPYKKQREEILFQQKDEEKQDVTVIAEFMKELRKLADKNLVIFDEALTSAQYLAAYLPRTQEGTFFQTRGGSLGVGIPGGMGIKLACPEKQVVVFTGDGGSMYTIQALHAASRYHIPIKIVIMNNKRYHLLDNNLEVYRKEQQIPEHQLPDCFSLEPVIDFVTLARSMGVDGVKVETREDAATAADTLMCADKPFLVDLNCG
jgi:benzoylformate decarboxylase